MPHAIGFLWSAIAAAVGGVQPPVSSGNWFFASAFGAPPNDRYYSSTYSNIICEAEHLIGSGARSVLRLMIPNWAITSGNNTHAARITVASVECNGVRVPITFGGLVSVTIPAGQAKQESDDILPSAFGLTQFDVGRRLFVTFGGPAVTGTNRFILGNRKSPTPRCKMYQYNPATTTPSSGPGALSFAGSDFVAFNPGGNTEIAHGLIGKFVGADAPVYVACGDSIEWGLGAPDRVDGIGGWLHRGFFDADLVSNPIAHQFFCLSGKKYQDFLAVSSQVGQWCAYANRGYDGLGTNDFGQNPGTAVTLAQCQGYSQSLWTLMRNNGVSKIYKHKLLASITNASNATAVTEAAQVVQGIGWDTGGNVENYNAWLDTQISGSALTGIIPITGITGVNPRKWAVNGVTPKLMSDDGLHVSEYAQTLMAPIWRETRVNAA